MLGDKNVSQISNELSQGYILWAKYFVQSDDYLAALDKIALAEQTASSVSAVDQAIITRSSILDTFSKSSSKQAQDLMIKSAKTVCTQNTPAMPQVPIIGINPDIMHVLLYGLNIKLSNTILATTPSASYYVACVTAIKETFQTCPYQDGYNIERVATNWLVEMRYLLTGRIYKQVTISGESPEGCPFSHLFQNGVFTVIHSGKPPTQGELELWLSKYIK